MYFIRYKMTEKFLISWLLSVINLNLDKIEHEIGLNELQKLKPIDEGDLRMILFKIVQEKTDLSNLRDIVCKYLLQKSDFDTTDIKYQLSATSQYSISRKITHYFEELIQIHTPIDGGNFVKSANKN